MSIDTQDGLNRIAGELAAVKTELATLRQTRERQKEQGEEEPPKGGIFGRVLDSTVVLAAVFGVCYTLGYLVELSDARKLGLPRHLLPASEVYRMSRSACC